MEDFHQKAGSHPMEDSSHPKVESRRSMADYFQMEGYCRYPVDCLLKEDSSHLREDFRCLEDSRWKAGCFQKKDRHSKADCRLQEDYCLRRDRPSKVDCSQKEDCRLQEDCCHSREDSRCSQSLFPSSRHLNNSPENTPARTEESCAATPTIASLGLLSGL